MPLIERFNERGEKVDGRPVFVEGRTMSSGEAEEKIASGALEPLAWTRPLAPDGSGAASLQARPAGAARLLGWEAEDALVDQPSDDRRTRGDAELREDAAKVGRDRPRADVEDRGHRLRRVSLRNHARDLELPSAQAGAAPSVLTRRPGDGAADAVDLDVEEDARRPLRPPAP